VDARPFLHWIVDDYEPWQRTEQRVAGIDSAGWMFTAGRGDPIHPHAISQSRTHRAACLRSRHSPA